MIEDDVLEIMVLTVNTCGYIIFRNAQELQK